MRRLFPVKCSLQFNLRKLRACNYSLTNQIQLCKRVVFSDNQRYRHAAQLLFTIAISFRYIIQEDIDRMFLCAKV